MRHAPWSRLSFALALAGSSALCAQQAITYTFRDASGSLFAPGSWVDGVVPPNDGSAALEFAPTSQIVADFGANGSFDAYSITLTLGSGSSLQLEDGFGGGTFGIGAGGVNVSGSFGYLWFSSSEVSLLGDQTWSATANTTIYALTTVSGTAELTLTGGGEFIFSDSNNTFSGDLLIDSGTLRVAGSSTLSDGVITSGPAGTGTLYLGSGVSLDVWGQEALLHNDVALGDSVEFGSSLDLPLTLAGVITPQQLATTVRLKSDSRVYFAGSLVESTEGTGSSFTFEGEGAAILDGTNSYTGGTTIDGAAVIFGNANALPATGTIAVLNGGYVGAAYEAGPQAILDQVTDVSTFTGTLGLDSDPDEAPNVFTDAFDFSDFDAEFFRGLGSFSHAVFSGTVTPVGGASYKFGGGSGWLIVTADLSHAGSGSLLVQSDPAYPLGLVLQGDNDFAGDMYVEGSVVVLDSANALPTGATISLGQYGYVGYTERFTGVTSFADFLSHFDSEGTDSSRTVGLDSADPTNPRTVADAIDLSEIDAASLGTATAVKLTGMISAPADGTLRLIGVKGGQLDVQSVLDSTRVARLEVGSSQLSFGADGLVRLAGDNTYTGGTTWFSGALVVGGDSALGAGPLDVRNPHPDRSPTLLSDLGTEVLLSNAITLEHGTLQIGLPTFLDPDGHEGKWSTYQGSDDARQLLTLTGDISGPASLYVSNYVTLTLGGANTFQFGTRVAENSLVIATSDTAFGEDGVHLERGADLEFRSAAPVVSGIGADGVRHTTDASYIALVDSAQTPVTLTLDLPGNDFRNLRAHIGGVPTDYTGTGAPPATNGALVKTGTGTLALRETSTYTGGTTIRDGTLIAAQTGALGTGTITLDGGKLAIIEGDFGNTLDLRSGVLTGNASFITASVGAGVTLSPGYVEGQNAAVGEMSFHHLSLAGGGTIEWNLADPEEGAGFGWDLITISTPHTLAISANAQNPFTLKLTTISSTGGLTTLTGFVVGETYTWKIFATDHITGFSNDAFLFDTTGFLTDAGTGSFWLTKVNQDLYLNFSPVPEPSTYALLALGLGLVGVTAWRRRRARE